MSDPATRVCAECGLSLSGSSRGNLCPGCAFRLALSPEATESERPSGALPGLKSRFFGDYEILDEIARGGMGVVYRARQLGLNRLVALKMIQSGHLLSDEARLRFRVEIEAVSQLDHPHIVSLYDSGEHDGAHYFTMRLIEGGDLGADFKRERPLRLRIRQLVKVCRAIHHAHQRGILHRDLKPSNILVDAEGEPHVADFGLAKSLDHDTGFTFTQSVLGSPNYMAPEQAAGKTRQLTTAVDVYGLGAVLYHLLAGGPPFQALTPVDTLRQVMDRDPIPPRQLRSAVDRDLETIALKCLRKQPTERYGTAEELALDLERWLAGRPILARPLGPLASGWRWTRRHPGLVLLGAALFIALLTLAGGATVAAWRIRSANQRNEALVTRMQIQKAETLFSEGSSSKALATLAHVVRHDPTNTPATLRLLSALQHRRYSVPIYAPMANGSALVAATSPPGKDELFTLSQAGIAQSWNLKSGTPLNTVFDLQTPIRIATMSPGLEVMILGLREGGAQIRSGPAWNAVRELAVLPHGVVALALSPSGRLAATASARLQPSFLAEVGLWETATGRAISAPKAHRLLVTDLQFTRDEQSLVSVCADSRIRFWPVSNTSTSPSLVLTQASCLILRFDRSGRWMAVGEYGGGIHVWDTRDLAQPKWVFRHARRINDLNFNADASLLLSASSDDSAQLWDLTNGTPHGPALRHGNIVNTARFSPDGRQVVTASNDNTARLWDALTGRALTEELPHDNGVQLAEFTGDGRRILTTTFAGACAVFELREPFVPTLTIAFSNTVTRVGFSPDGHRLAAGSTGGEIRVTDVQSGEVVRQLTGNGAMIPTIFSPDGKRIATGGDGRTVQIFDVASGALVLPPLRHGFSVEGLEFDRSGSRLLVTTEVEAQIWDMATGKKVAPPLPHRDRIESARLSPDGQRVITVSKDRTVRLWSAVTGEPIGPPIEDAGLAIYAEFSPDAERVVLAKRAHEAVVISLSTREMVGTPMRHRGGVSHAAFNHDGSRIVTASEDQTAKVWAPDAPEPLLQTLPHRARVNRAEFSPDGRMILTLSSDGQVLLWDTATGHLIADPIQHPGATFACFSPDGHRVAVSAKSGLVVVRPVPTWAGGDVTWMADLAELVAQQRFLPPDRFDPLPPGVRPPAQPTASTGPESAAKSALQRWLRRPATP